MTPKEFEFIAGLLKRESGLIFTAEKLYLLESRLAPIVRARSLKGIDAVIALLMTGRDLTLQREVVEAMTTNETFFFRDVKPFDQFRTVTLPQLIQSRADRKRIRIWSAASSTGQEPYTLAMIIRDFEAKLAGWNIEIIATDLSTEALGKARAGIYSSFEVQRGLPVNFLIKYFKQQGDQWQISDLLRNMVTYRTFNLLGSYAGLGQFDLVFCRNVLIYFDLETKGKVLGNIASVMAPDATLYLGGAETVVGVSSAFTPVPSQRGLYAKSR